MAINSNNFFVTSFLEKVKLTVINFLDWQRNLRIVLKQERKLYVIDIPRPAPLPEGASCAQYNVYQKHIDDDTDVQCLMLATMSAELQKQHENMNSYDMIEHLKRMFEGQARQERFDTFKSLHAYKNPTKLLVMLKTAETNVQKASPAPMIMALKPKGGVPKVGDCHYCKKPGHWKMNYHIYMEDLKKKKVVVSASNLGIYVIEVNLSTSTSWVFDTGCGSHICLSVQELQGSRTLAKGEVDLRVGNRAKVAALAVGTYRLSLPTGLVLELDNCFYMPAISKNIISVSCLDKKDTHVYNINNDNKRIKMKDSNQTCLWYCRLGHINEKRISKLHQDGYLDKFIFE
ncbi:hypothetical protein AgCh_014458 [Apium graveolens]